MFCPYSSCLVIGSPTSTRLTVRLSRNTSTGRSPSASILMSKLSPLSEKRFAKNRPFLLVLAVTGALLAESAGMNVTIAPWTGLPSLSTTTPRASRGPAVAKIGEGVATRRIETRNIEPASFFLSFMERRPSTLRVGPPGKTRISENRDDRKSEVIIALFPRSFEGVRCPETNLERFPIRWSR